MFFLLTGPKQLLGLVQQLILQNFPPFFFFRPQEGIQCAFSVNWEINIICSAGSTASVGDRNRQYTTKGTIHVVMLHLRWEIHINSIFSGLTRLPTEAAHKLTHEQSQHNLLFFFCISFFCPSCSYCCNTFHFRGTKGKKGGEENGGGQEYTCLIIALWMKHTITAGISTRHPAN